MAKLPVLILLGLLLQLLLPHLTMWLLQVLLVLILENKRDVLAATFPLLGTFVPPAGQNVLLPLLGVVIAELHALGYFVPTVVTSVNVTFLYY